MKTTVMTLILALALCVSAASAGSMCTDDEFTLTWKAEHSEVVSKLLKSSLNGDSKNVRANLVADVIRLEVLLNGTCLGDHQLYGRIMYSQDIDAIPGEILVYQLKASGVELDPTAHFYHTK